MSLSADGVNRPYEPQLLPAHLRQSYVIRRPGDTHWRPATCEEAGCDAYLHGWRTLIDTSQELGQRQADYIRKESGRAFAEDTLGPDQVVFVFDAGQRCFRSSEHQVEVGREPLFLVRGGDHRGNPTRAMRLHTSAEPWADDFASHQQELADKHAQG